MKALFTVTIVFAVLTVNAQLDRPWTQYFQAPYLQNAALSGIEPSTDIKAGFKRQWASFDGAPANYFLGVNHRLNNAADSSSTPALRQGISAFVAGSDYNAMSEIQTGAGYAVHVPIAQHYYLSFGLALNYQRTKADINQLIARDKTDAVYINLVNSGGALSYFNMDAGAVIYSDRLYAGYSATRLVRSRVGSDLSGNEQSSIRHALMAGYVYRLNETFELQPTILYRKESGVKDIVSFTGKVRYKSMLWGGLAYMPGSSVSILAGYLVKNNLSVSYSYDINTGSLHTASAGSHELILGIAPFNKSMKKPFFW